MIGTGRVGRANDAGFLLALLALAALIRLALLARASWLLDGDDALSALMALNVLDGDRPLMLKNQAYAAAWQAYGMALSFDLLGISRPAARLPSVLASLGLVLTTWLWTNEVGGPAAARFGAALAAVPPIYELVLSLKPFAPYAEAAVLGSLAVWSATRLACRPPGRRDRWWAAGCGLAGGLALWMHPVAIEHLIPAALLILLGVRGLRLLGAVTWGALGFAVGGLPIWLFNVQSRGATVQYILTGSRGQTADRLDVLVAWWQTDLPRGAGLWQPWGPSPRDLGVVLAVLLVLALGWALLQHRPPGARLRPIDSVLLTFLSVLTVVYLSGFSSLVINPWGFDATGRYTLPLWSGLTVLLGAFFGAVSSWRKPAGLALAGVVLAANGFGWLVADPVQAFQSPYWPRLPADNGPLLATLRDQAIWAAWMNHWAGLAVMFDARVAGQPLVTYDWYDAQAGGIDRFPEHLPRVEQADRAAFVLVTDEPEPELESRLRQAGVVFHETRVPPYVVVLPESRSVHPSEVTSALDYRY